ncbi:PepSY domain-containing protein [Ascidiimonas aurantiaca]|uniref:PepSY domain-containing protein n=1 Tax=Ascidiimonas aurantiaca TaxID=1685432 RepID=UPI0030EED572
MGSLWRYSHFLLATVSAVFLLMASLTGAILAIQPIKDTVQPYKTVSLDNVQLSQTITVLKNRYAEVLELEITPEGFVKVSVLTKDGESANLYIDPETGDKLGEVSPPSAFFSFVTNLHRSLFLKSVGRAFVGIVSLLLFFIAISGVFLLAQRQGGFKKWFSKVQESNFGQRYHVILSRWFLLPISIIALTGVYLSAEKFALLPEVKMAHQLESIADFDAELVPQNIALFESTRLSEVRKLIFPFSDAPEDYFELALRDREILVHQYSGEVLSEIPYPFVLLASRWSLKWHTGQGSIFWSVVLLIASLSILFFIYSGLQMSIKRRRRYKKAVVKYTKDEAEYVILVGSETRNTHTFANAFHKALEKAGKTVYLSTLNAYSTYEKASHLIIFTATYGDGDPPASARKFEQVFKKVTPHKSLQFSVVGFGSLRYPHYCLFAVKVHTWLSNHSNFVSVQPLAKINDQSHSAFMDWVKAWNEQTGMQLKVTLPNLPEKKLKEYSFKVIERTPLNTDNTALIRLRPSKKRIRFQSGDLLNIIPPEDPLVIRKYSIAKMENDILLSVKWHPKGICSTYLCHSKIGDTITGSIENNTNFHFPRQASSVWMVANGTGIAPYLGMLIENREVTTRLTWGGRTETSFDYYKDYIEEALSKNTLDDYQIALSRTVHKSYVQDILFQHKEKVAQTLTSGGAIMLCGSLAMQNGVLDTLEEITQTELKKPLSDFENNGQLLMDCY